MKEKGLSILVLMLVMAVLFSLCIGMCGCMHGNYKKTMTDGAKIEVDYWRAGDQSLSGVNIETENGIKVSLDQQQAQGEAVNKLVDTLVEMFKIYAGSVE